MTRPSSNHHSPRTAAVVLAALAVVALLGGAAVASGAAQKRVVGKAANETLGRYVLTNTKGHTLYALSAEKNGRFICVGGCLRSWAPLTVPAGTKPTGPVRLGTIARPEGGTQVTYQGRPLYAFRGDRSRGDVEGEGFKDVGTWHAVTLGRIPASEPEPEEPGNPYPYRGTTPGVAP